MEILHDQSDNIITILTLIILSLVSAMTAILLDDPDAVDNYKIVRRWRIVAMMLLVLGIVIILLSFIELLNHHPV